jgi:hypothetical protein
MQGRKPSKCRRVDAAPALVTCVPEAVRDIFDLLRHDVGRPLASYCSSRTLLDLLFTAAGTHEPGPFEGVMMHISRGPSGRHFEVPWSWLRAYAFTNYPKGVGMILHTALCAAAHLNPPKSTTHKTLLKKTKARCRGCGGVARSNKPMELSVGAPSGRTCWDCIRNPKWKNLYYADTESIRRGNSIPRKLWSDVVMEIRDKVGTLKYGLYGHTLYPYTRTRELVARMRMRRKRKHW